MSTSGEEDKDNDDHHGVPLFYRGTRVVFGGAAPREDSHSLPAKGTQWSWNPTKRLLLMKDGASAAENAAATVWADHIISAHMCSWHASTRWMQQNPSLLRDKKHRKMILDDFEAFKDCPTLSLVPGWKDAMLTKWRREYRELELAEAWEKSWGEAMLTRVESNRDNPLRGGIPSDNNNVESGNSTDKLDRDHKKSASVVFIQEFAHRLEDISKADTKFVGDMKSDDRFNSVHSIAFYDQVESDMIVPHQEGLPSCLSLQFALSAVAMDIPKGSFLVGGASFVQSVLDSREYALADSADDLKAFLQARRGEGNHLLDTAREMYKRPDTFVQGRDFDALTRWSRKFHLMKPLLPGVSLGQDLAVASLHEMLESNGIGIVCLDVLMNIKDVNKCLMSCDCGTYLMRGWCKHAYGIARQRGIINGYPLTKDPRKTRVMKKGRKKNAKRGGALGFD